THFSRSTRGSLIRRRRGCRSSNRAEKTYAVAPVFLAVLDFLALAADAACFRVSAVCAPNRFVNRSTRPSGSISFWRPVKNGWHTLQISRCSSGFVERVLNVLPHAQRTSTSWYFGWIPGFTVSSLAVRPKDKYNIPPTSNSEF